MSLRPFFVQFFCVFLPPLLNIFCFCQVLNIFCFCPLWCRSLHESFLCYLIFLKRSLNFSHSIVFPLFVCTDHLGRLSYHSLPFFETLHSDGYIFPFLLCFQLLFSVICKASSDSHFACLHFFFLEMVLITASCTRVLITTSYTVSQTSVHSSSGTLSDLIP